MGKEYKKKKERERKMDKKAGKRKEINSIRKEKKKREKIKK